MNKYGVVDGISKTAAADNAEDAIGAAARCIKDAKDAMSEVSGIVSELGRTAGPEEDKKAE